MSVLAPHTHVQASVFNVFDAYFSKESLKIHLFAIYFSDLVYITSPIFTIVTTQSV